MVGFMVSVIVTVNVHELLKPTLSVAVHVTVVGPNGNTKGFRIVGDGTHPTLAIPLPSVVVADGVYDDSVTVADTPLVGVP